MVSGIISILLPWFLHFLDSFFQPLPGVQQFYIVTYLGGLVFAIVAIFAPMALLSKAQTKAEQGELVLAMVSGMAGITSAFLVLGFAMM